VRCTRCGNDNPEPNRFCGMCGASLLAGPVPAPTQPQPVLVSSAAAAAPELAPARTEPVQTTHLEASSDDRPAISGPSFLGLNDPPPSHSSPRKRARLSIDPHSAPGSDLEYLLSDEEQPSHWGPGKILLILIALALALGFGYLRWKTHGFSWLNPPVKKPDAAVAQNAPSDNTPQQTAPSGATQESLPAANQPSTTSSQPSPDGAAANANPAASAPPPSTAPVTATPNPLPATEAARPGDATPPAGANTSSADKDSASSREPTAAPPTSKRAEASKPAPRRSTPKPSAASKPVVAADPVTEAQKYLYGKGVPQDCERGMRLLKPAANQSNAKAMVEMGALYSAGLCTPHDLPTAYRWFALALRKDPENTAAQEDLSKLWSEMTPPERQLAIKLSQ